MDGGGTTAPKRSRADQLSGTLGEYWRVEKLGAGVGELVEAPKAVVCKQRECDGDPAVYGFESMAKAFAKSVLSAQAFCGRNI
jgi:hypothetical protein